MLLYLCSIPRYCAFEKRLTQISAVYLLKSSMPPRNMPYRSQNSYNAAVKDNALGYPITEKKKKKLLTDCTADS